MKKLIAISFIILFNTNVLADKMTKSGLVSDWVEEVSGVERIVISQDNKVNGKSCSVWGKPIKNYHDIDRANCFKEFNPKILDFIASRVE